MKKVKIMAAIVLATLVIFCASYYVSAASTYTSGDFEYIISNNKVIITGYKGNSSVVTIPATINGREVYSVACNNVNGIAVRPFSGNNTVEKVIISEGIKGVDKNIFYKCPNLKEVVFPDSLAFINGPVKLKCDNYTFTVPEGFYELDSPIKQKYRKDLVTVNVSGTNDYDMAKQVWQIVNQERAKVGLPALNYDENLCKAAEQRAAELAVYCNHERPTVQDFYTVIEDLGIQMNATTFGENLCAGYTSAESAMIAWMNSPGHKANILKTTYTNIGVGVFATDNAIYWLQIFSNGDSKTTYNATGNKRVSVKVQIASGLGVLQDTKVQGFTDSIKLKVGETIRPTNVTIGNIEFFNYETNIAATDVSWTTSNRSIATVTTQGTVKGIKPGTATITATLGEFTKTYNVTVTGSNITSGSSLESPEYEIGDINMDGSINAIDAALVLDAYKGVIELTDEQMQLADINQDEQIDVQDAGLILDIFKGIK